MAHPGTLHRYTPRLVAFEHSSPHSPSSSPPEKTNTLLFIPGLSDGLLTVHYPTTLSHSLPPTWRIAELLLSSSYTGWATSSLSRDAREIRAAVRYFRAMRPEGKIALMGHSTGCQDVMEVCVGKDDDDSEEGRIVEIVDAAILQGGISDREGWWGMLGEEDDEAKKKELESIIAQAKDMLDAGRGEEVMPRNFVAKELGARGGITAYRTWSLLAGGGDDDYFSSDLPDADLERSFGRLGELRVKVCLLLGGRDEFVPSGVDKRALVERWAGVVRGKGGWVDERNGGVVEGAGHNLNGDPEVVVQDLVGRVVRFLKAVEGEEEGAKL